MKRKPCIIASVILAFLLTNSILFASEQNLTLTLEYEIPNGVERVFSEDCELALCVQEIKADSKALSYFDDVRIIPKCPVNYVSPTGKSGKIKMVWKKIGSNYVWNDGRGILFSKSESGFFIPRTNSFKIPADTKKIEITYKVLLPTDDIEENSLLDSLPKNGYYTATYRYHMILR